MGVNGLKGLVFFSTFHSLFSMISVELSFCDYNYHDYWYRCYFCSDELIVLSASGTAACIDLQLATGEPTGVGLGILCMCVVTLSVHQ